jgi:hypothetical protein
MEAQLEKWLDFKKELEDNIRIAKEQYKNNKETFELMLNMLKNSKVTKNVG